MHEEIVGIVFLGFAVFLFFSLLVPVTGKVGGALDFFFKGLFGVIAFVLPFVFILYGVLLLAGNKTARRTRTIIFTVVLFLMLLIINSGHFVDASGAPLCGPRFSQIYMAGDVGESGGVIGMYIAMALVNLIGKTGLYIFSAVGVIVSILLIAGQPLSPFFGQIKARRESRRRKMEERLADELESEEVEIYDGEQLVGREKRRGYGHVEDEEPNKRKPPLKILDDPDHSVADKRNNILSTVMDDPIHGDVGGGFGIEPPREERSLGLGDYDDPIRADDGPPKEKGEPRAAGRSSDRKAGKAETMDGFGFTPEEAAANYRLPPIDLLNRGPKAAKAENASELKSKAARLEQAMRDFRVEAKVIKVTVGPTVTRFEVEPDVGVKIQSIKSLEQDLALKLEVRSVRVVPMPGQSVVGIEAYNANTSIVTLRDIIDSPDFRTEDSKIAFALGKNISGKRIITDLKDMPHLLIAGTTGSGKSVCINSILLSILYRARPDEVKLILVDPKVVELKSYNDIPHLLVPVVTDPEKAATALGYAVTIMNDRYKLFAERNVRNLEAYNNALIKEGKAAEVLPQVVIVIDELSDLMMIAPAKVQESISRLAAMARAAGMHLIVATQQPLASILTSVIKANIPSRIAFSVSSNSASRVILDDGGAERLHGNGDMLFSPVGSREPMRIQGAFVSDSEVHKVTEYIKREMDPDYSTDIMDVVNSEPTGNLVDDEDELYRDALEMVVHDKKASTSMIQRRFRIGYNRAARLVDMMEERGIVAPSDGTNKPRNVLITEAQMAEHLGGGTFMAEDPEGDREPPFDMGRGDG